MSKTLACQKMRPESLTTKCSEELREPPGTVCLWPLPEIPVPHPASVWLKCSVEGASCSTSSAPNLCPYPLFSTIDPMINRAQVMTCPEVQYHPYMYGRACIAWTWLCDICKIIVYLTCNPLWTFYAIDRWWQIVNPSHFWSVPRETWSAPSVPLKRTQRTLEAYPAYPWSVPSVPFKRTPRTPDMYLAYLMHRTCPKHLAPYQRTSR